MQDVFYEWGNVRRRESAQCTVHSAQVGVLGCFRQAGDSLELGAGSRERKAVALRAIFIKRCAERSANAAKEKRRNSRAALPSSLFPITEKFLSQTPPKPSKKKRGQLLIANC